MLDWYRSLIALRRHPSLADDRFDRCRVLHLDEERRAIAVARGDVTIVANLGAVPTRYRPPADRDARLLLGSGVRWETDELALDGHSVAVLGGAP